MEPGTRQQPELEAEQRSQNAHPAWDCVVHGRVQGVGFRPHVARLARSLGVTGRVSNTGEGVELHVEGSPGQLSRFVESLRQNPPEHARIDEITVTEGAPTGDEHFTVDPSPAATHVHTEVPRDVAACPTCVEEVFTPGHRRFGYPFTTCAGCGPRFTILTGLPFDRPRTTMARFVMCEDCEREYPDPDDRRFHAQTISCPRCGPRLWLSDDQGRCVESEQPIARAARALSAGWVLAVKGVGGFQLVVDAGNSEGLRRLRRGKDRPEKPFAVMMPSLTWAGLYTHVSSVDRQLLESPEAPIVLLRRRAVTGREIDPLVAPDNARLGVMLPYSPLHHLLMQAVGCPLVVTSGNRRDEPIATDDAAARHNLGPMVDLFLTHELPIAHRADDSVVRSAAGGSLVLRRARGYAPGQFPAPESPRIRLAVGGDGKNTFAVAVGKTLVLSQHIGSLESREALHAAQVEQRESLNLFGQKSVDRVICDAHPDYVSTRKAEQAYAGLVTASQHHAAHVYSCMAEHGLKPPVIGVSWDGTGYGGDGTIWGGEVLRVDARGWHRISALRPFRLPGGEKCAREPRRSGLGILAELGMADSHTLSALGVEHAFDADEVPVLIQALDRGWNAPLTTSVGRLFDATAFCLGLGAKTSFEGQAAMALEALAEEISDSTPLPLPWTLPGSNTKPQLDWRPMMRELIARRMEGDSPTRLALGFHRALAAAVASGLSFWEDGDDREVPLILTGGVFQNRVLLEETQAALRQVGREAVIHRTVPPNDGGLALGQLYADLCLEDRSGSLNGR